MHAGGRLLTAISTSIVGILRDHYGRGPMRAKNLRARRHHRRRHARQRIHAAREDDHEQRPARPRHRHARGLPARHVQALARTQSRSSPAARSSRSSARPTSSRISRWRSSSSTARSRASARSRSPSPTSGQTRPSRGRALRAATVWRVRVAGSGRADRSPGKTGVTPPPTP